MGAWQGPSGGVDGGVVRGMVKGMAGGVVRGVVRGAVTTLVSGAMCYRHVLAQDTAAGEGARREGACLGDYEGCGWGAKSCKKSLSCGMQLQVRKRGVGAWLGG